MVEESRFIVVDVDIMRQIDDVLGGAGETPVVHYDNMIAKGENPVILYDNLMRRHVVTTVDVTTNEPVA